MHIAGRRSRLGWGSQCSAVLDSRLNSLLVTFKTNAPCYTRYSFRGFSQSKTFKGRFLRWGAQLQSTSLVTRESVICYGNPLCKSIVAADLMQKIKSSELMRSRLICLAEGRFLLTTTSLSNILQSEFYSWQWDFPKIRRNSLRSTETWMAAEPRRKT